MTTSEALKAATGQLHMRAERHPVQFALISGRATVQDYAAYLSQMHWLQEALEGALRELQDHSLAAIVRPHHFRAHLIGDDIAALDVEVQGPLPATERACELMRALLPDAPEGVIGVLYVFEGATNGGVYIAKAIRRSLALPEARGTQYLDPHGSFQVPKWREFRESLNALPDACRDRVIAGAVLAFESICAVFDNLHEAAQGGEVHATSPSRCPTSPARDTPSSHP